jgi:hypothetical protein
LIDWYVVPAAHPDRTQQTDGRKGSQPALAPEPKPGRRAKRHSTRDTKQVALLQPGPDRSVAIDHVRTLMRSIHARFRRLVWAAWRFGILCRV